MSRAFPSGCLQVVRYAYLAVPSVLFYAPSSSLSSSMRFSLLSFATGKPFRELYSKAVLHPSDLKSSVDLECLKEGRLVCSSFFLLCLLGGWHGTDTGREKQPAYGAMGRTGSAEQTQAGVKSVVLHPFFSPLESERVLAGYVLRNSPSVGFRAPQLLFGGVPALGEWQNPLFIALDLSAGISLDLWIKSCLC